MHICITRAQWVKCGIKKNTKYIDIDMLWLCHFCVVERNEIFLKKLHDITSIVYVSYCFMENIKKVVQSVNKICFDVIYRCEGPPGCACVVTATVSLSHIVATLLLCGCLSAMDTWSLRHCGTQVATQTLQGKSGLMHWWGLLVHFDGLMQEIKNNAWVTVNNDFWVTSEAICQ